MTAPTITRELSIRYALLTRSQCKAMTRQRPDGTAIPVIDDDATVIIAWLPLDAMHVADLRRMARVLDVEGRSRLAKAQLMVEVADGLARRQSASDTWAQLADTRRADADAVRSDDPAYAAALDSQAAVYAARSARLAVA